MKNKKIVKILILSSFSIFIFSGLIKRVFNEKNYQKALSYLYNTDYENAISCLEGLENYKDANYLKEEAENGKQYEIANSYIHNGEYKKAIKKLDKIRKRSVDKELIKKIEQLLIVSKYKLAVQYYDNKEYDKAKKLFFELSSYEKSEEYLDEIDKIIVKQLTKDIYSKACKFFDNEDYEKALGYFESILDYKDSKNKTKECKNQIRRRNLNTTIAGGHRHSVAINDDNIAIAVGDTDDHRCDLEGFNNMVSIAAGGTFTIGFDKDGKIKIAGRYNDNQKVDTNKKKWKESKFIDVAAGQQFVVGLTNKGKVIRDGHGDDGQIDCNGWNEHKFIAIDAGWRFTVGLTENKELKFSGIYGNQLKEFQRNKNEWKDVVNISAAGGDTTGKERGKGHTVGLKSDGSVIAVGDNSWGQCDVYDKRWRNIVKVVAGDWYTVGLKANGQVLITGNNRPGTEYIEEDMLKRINKKKDVVDIAAGYGQTIFLHKDGTISAFKFDKEQKTNIVLKKWQRKIKLPNI